MAERIYHLCRVTLALFAFASSCPRCLALRIVKPLSRVGNNGMLSNSSHPVGLGGHSQLKG